MTDLNNTTSLTQPTKLDPYLRAIKQVRYKGPSTPTLYDANWRKFTNLTPEQIKTFQAMPETCQQVARGLRHAHVLGAMPKITADMTLAQVQAACDAAKAAVAAPFATEATVTAGIGKTVHTQADVEAAFKASADK